MTKARSADYASVTDVIVRRNRPEVELPLALFLSFIGHIALLIFLSVFQGFEWLSGNRESLNLGTPGGDEVLVETIDIGLPVAMAPEVSEIEVPEAPAPETVEFEEPSIEIPDVDAEAEFAPPPEPPKEEPKKAEPKPTVAPTAKPTTKPTTAAAKTPAVKPPGPAKATAKGSIAMGVSASGPVGPGSGGFGGEGPSDPGLAFWAQRASTLIAEVFRQPSVNAPTGTLIECVIFFVVTRDGRVSDVSIERSSGIPNMDQNALRAVMDTGQLPALPPTFRGNELTVSFTFRYQAGQ